jgi:outer membrane protein assembly factor BamB
MRIPKPTCTMASIVLVLLLIFSAFTVFPNSTCNAVEASSTSANVNLATEYGNLSQYEWPQIHGNPAFTRFSEGPAPEAPDIMWTTTISGVQSFVAAFNGKVFVTTSTDVIALDKDEGNIIWRAPLPTTARWPAAYKIDETHLVVGKTCLETETGKVLWSSDEFSASTSTYAEGVYSPEERIFYIQGKSSVQAWDFSNPSKPPTLAWETPVPGSGSVGSGIQYGDGKVFPGSFEPHQMALDAKTGQVLWDTETKGAMTFSGSYYQGKFLRGGGHDNTFYCFDAETGKILWTFNPGTQYGYWSSGCAAAYGKVYQLNKDGHLYAIDVNTGKLAWKYKGPGFLFFPGWPVVADGKVYATTGQAVSKDPITGEYSKSEFACLDAFTGNLVWKLPIQAYAPRESTAIAYGNLYLIPGYIEENEMDTYVVPNEVWAIGTNSWPMWRRDPAHTATGQSGPTNLTLRWNFTTGGGVISSPSVVDGRVYVGSQDKNVYCLDARNGGLVWKFETGFRIKSSPAVANGKVYIGPDDGYIYCLNAQNGSVLWKKYAGGYLPVPFASVARLCSSPTIVGDRLYVGSLDNNTYCLDANSGDVKWIYPTLGPITSSPAVVDGAVYIISQEPIYGALFKLDANNGSRIWKLEIPHQMKARGTDIHASPTVAAGMVFASANKLEYYGINATTGEIKWTYRNLAEEFIVCSTTFHEGKLFLIDQFFIVCVNATNGVSIWRSWLGAEVYVSPTYADGKLYVTSDQRSVYVLNASTGRKLSWFGTGSNSWSSPTLYEGRVYVGNHDQNVYCLADYPALASNVTITLEKNKSVLGESVNVSGQLTPEIAYAPISVTCAKPDGTIDDLEVSTLENGTFSFNYSPDMVGVWAFTASWQSDKGYYSSAYSEDKFLEVIEQQPPLPLLNEIPIAYVYAGAAIVAIVIVAAAGYVWMRRPKK